MSTELIRRVPNWETLTPEEIRNSVSTEESRPTGLLIKFEMITKLLGLEYRTLAMHAMFQAKAVDPDIDGAYLAMTSGAGLDLSEPDKQETIEKLGQHFKWTPEQIAKLKSLGIKTASKWEHETGHPLPSLEWFTDAKAAELAKDTEQATAEQRRRDYQDLRNWLVRLSGPALSKLKQLEDADKPAPTKAEILEWLGAE